ncbi:MAG TPA: adenylyltransferase/cytidyltransferase family protein [bacterium]
MREGKVLTLGELAERVAALKGQGLRVAHCHGCFDLVHPGHIKHLQAARRLADALVVTVSPDRFVDKGPGRPAFPEQLRAESVAALECVDYAAVNAWPTAEETIRLLRPTYFVKGQEFEAPEARSEKLKREIAVLEQVGGEMRFTHELVSSSTALLKRYFAVD